jgi:release factor glutamine methyltransferase
VDIEKRVDIETTVGRLRAAGCVFAEDEARLLHEAGADPAGLESMVDRRVGGEPLEQILGWAWFHGLRIAVEPGVFVPRRRTELLVGLAMSLARPGSAVVDLCCGSGAIGAAIADAVGTIELYAVDVDPAAVRCARRNVPPGSVVLLGDLFEPLPSDLRHRVEVLAANVPYVPSAAIATMPPEARDHEPRTALDGGPDGLDVLRRVAAGAPEWLAPGGHLLIETSDEQATHAAEAFAANGLAPRVARDDDLGSTVVIGQST